MKTIHQAVTLDYYDGPILFEARDRIGGNYLAVAGDGAGGDPVYAVVGISPERLHDFRNGMVDLHDVMLEEGSEEWFLATPNWATDDFQLEPQDQQLAESGYLPAKGYRLDPAVSSNVAVLDAAQRRDNLVIELKAEPRESENGHRIHLSSLMELLNLMQKLVGHAYRAARRESHDRSYTAMPVEEAVLMDVVVPAMAGSFCMLLEAGSGTHDAGERELAQGLRRVDLLFEHAGSKVVRQSVSHLKETGGHLAATYVKLLNFLAKEEVGFHYTWAEPNFSCARRQSISAARARRLSRRFAELVERESDEVTLVGRLVKADLKTGQWRLESRERAYIGNVAGDCSQLDGLVVGRRYRFWCTKVVEKKGATGKKARRLYLDRTEGA